MPPESVRDGESNEKRKPKNKIPKRLRRKNKQNDINSEENVTNNIPTTDHVSSTKQDIVQESAPFSLNTSPSNTSDNPVVESVDETSMYYWRYCTKKALDILEKQASNRKKLLIERHQERINSIQHLLYQREQIDGLTEENQSMCQSLDSLRNELRTKEEILKTFEEKLHDRDDLIRDNEFLRVQLRLMEQKFERFTIEYSKKLDENRQHEHDYTEQIQSLLGEIERIKRDLVLEEYRKQEAERKVRYYDEKIKIEQNFNKKIQQDFLQLKQELKTIHLRYDSLQIEMLAMHQANHNDISLIPTKDTNENEWPKKRTRNHEIDEHTEIKRSKRRASSASTASNSSEKRNRIPTKSSNNKETNSNQPSLTIKRKTSKSNKTTKKHLPVVTLTNASPSSDQAILTEKNSTQLLPPPSVSTTTDSTTDTHDTSSESQPLKQQRIRKQSRYPCRRAQRPVKRIDTNDQMKQ